MATGFRATDILVIDDDDASLNLSIDTRSYAFDFSIQGIITPSWLGGSISRVVWDLNSISVVGGHWSSYADVFYNHIWIIPSTIDLTGAPLNFSTTFIVWNSYFVSKTLTSVPSMNISGINLTGPTSQTFNALQTQEYTLALTASTPPVVDGNYQFIFSNAEDPYLIVKGVLSVFFPFMHDWSQDVTERVGYLTDVIEVKSGKEQRIRLRKYPRRQLSYNVLLADNDDHTRSAIQRALFHNSMNYAMGKSWLIPICTDATVLQDNLSIGATTINVPTQYYDYNVDGYALIYKDFENYETVKIDSMNSTSLTLEAPGTARAWSKGITIAPLRQAVVAEEVINNGSIVYDVENPKQTWEIVLSDVANDRVTDYTPTYTYKGIDVCLDYTIHNFVDDPSSDIYTPQRRLDNGIGVFTLDPRYPYTRERATVKILLKNREEISRFLGFLEYRAGKYKSFWTPSHAKDFQILNSGTSSSSVLDVKYIGYSTYVKQNRTRRDLVLFPVTGNPIFKRIIGSNIDVSGNEEIALDSALGISWTPSTFKYVSYLRYVRFDADAIEMNWLTSTIAEVTIPFLDDIASPD